MDLYSLLSTQLPAQRLLQNEPMAAHTTFRVGGPAEVLFLPRDEEELRLAVRLARENGDDVNYIGRGSNLLVRDGGVDGLVICFGEAFSGIEAEGDTLIARAGDTLTHLSNVALERGLSGLEFASGIPGSVGGGMAMNAGAYGGQLSDVVLWARLMDPATGEALTLPRDELDMGYRSTRALKTGALVTQAAFRLVPGDKAEIKAKMDDFNRRRREKQPLQYPSAGSTFKRPEGHFAGALIEQAGLKGTRLGGAEVSQLHAGFIINTGSATARDILDLMALVTRRVYEASGVTLEPEVRIVGKD
ncbi:MAG: UDP-N-acetylmuramate dehydrogenase [Clostridia bacterium]|nr:UDP-N-acetylmuramate dehydrogenase [Clostridia bacterium]